MTRALVVYESLFGDGRRVAAAIADGLSELGPVEVVPAAEAPLEIGADVALLVVGGPNHMFGMPSPRSRDAAVKQYGADVADPSTGLHEWLEAVLLGGPLAAAAYDTRGADHPLISRLDHASRTERKLLGRTGAELVAPAEHFLVAGPKGPLVEGEEERARAWGRTLAQAVAARPVRSDGGPR
jgi:hypothetical protein